MGLIAVAQGTQLTGNIVTTANGASINMAGVQQLTVQANVVVNTPSAQVFASTAVNVTNDTATITAHGFTTGLKGQLTTTGGLPAGLSLATDYFIIVVDVNTVKFASSLANAVAGTQIDLTTQGTGNDTFTPTALAGATVQLQWSNNNSSWINDGSATAITVSAALGLVATYYGVAYYRVVATLTAGQMSLTNSYLGKGPN